MLLRFMFAALRAAGFLLALIAGLALAMFAVFGCAAPSTVRRDQSGAELRTDEIPPADIDATLEAARERAARGERGLVTATAAIDAASAASSGTPLGTYLAAGSAVLSIIGPLFVNARRNAARRRRGEAV